MIPLFKVFMTHNSEKDEELLKVLHSGYVGQGPKVEEFEAALKEFIGHPYILSLNNGTAALHLALHLIGVEGGEVIVTPMTCTATVWPILANRADVVWADIDPRTGMMDPNCLKELINERTKAILPVHWGGTPAALDLIHEAAKGIPVLEDAAHAFGAKYKGRNVGTISQYTAFSFQAIKHLTCVDGGALCVKDEATYKRGKLVRWYGIDREQPRVDFRCEQPIPEWGYKFHMNDVNATIGLRNIAKTREVIAAHRKNASYLYRELTKIGIQTVPMDGESVWWMYTIFVDNRPGFIKRMEEAGIQASRVHERVDIHPCVSKYRRELPGVDTFTSRMVCIPCGWWVGPGQLEHIVKTIKEGW